MTTDYETVAGRVRRELERAKAFGQPTLGLRESVAQLRQLYGNNVGQMLCQSAATCTSPEKAALTKMLAELVSHVEGAGQVSRDVRAVEEGRLADVGRPLDSQAVDEQLPVVDRVIKLANSISRFK